MATTVVTQQLPKMSGWSSGLFDCCQDMSSCCFALWCCPCFACSTTGQFGESPCLPLLDIFGPGVLSAFGVPVCVPPVTLSLRVALRHQHEISGTLCEDIMISCCCICCSWCQLAREIKERKKPTTIITQQVLVNPQVVQPVMVNPPVMQPVMVNPPVMQPAMVNPPVVQPVMVNPPVVQPVMVKPQVMTSTYVGPYH